jgi:23S rRNA pseudouridine2605 synthase
VHRTGPSEPQRIAKLLARAGVASRREIERMIADGRVALDGVALDTPATLLTSLRGVTVDGNPVQAATPARLFLFHKPPGTLTAANDPKGRRTIYDVLPRDLPRLMPVGRLDLATEGLLLMTTDGELKRQLELPATGVERAYRARAYGDVTQAQLEDLIDGVEIEGIRYGSIDANLERRTGANVWIEMVLTEGKNREVRRVLDHLGLKVSRLIRTRYGPFILGDLPVGAIGEVRQFDLVNFRASLKGNKAKATEEARANTIAVGAGTKPRRNRDAAPDAPPAAAGPRETGRPARALTARPSGAPQAGGRPARSAAPSTPRPEASDRERAPRAAGPARPPRAAGTSRTKRPGAQPQGRSRPPRSPIVRETRDERLETTRPRTERPRDDANATTPKPRPKRGAGWAKPKIKPRPGKPRRPRS